MRKSILLLLLLCANIIHLRAQTESDGIMMNKHNLCSGLTYSYSTWKDYWEGDFKRNNDNLGTVSTQSLSAMGNIGLRDNLNIIFSAPYIKTKASKGVLAGMKGLQDLSLFAKWRSPEIRAGASTIHLFGVLGGSLPLTNYVADFLPLSIGLRSKTWNTRIIADLQYKNFYITPSAAYIYRSNITIDRNAYYTDEMIYANEVFMPNVFTTRTGLGYRKGGDLIIEGVMDTWNTLGGFDIRKNDMPFPSNRMIIMRAGVNFKLPVPKIHGLSLVGNIMHTLDGRNVGQATAFTGGLFYVIQYKKLKPANTNSTTPTIK